MKTIFISDAGWMDKIISHMNNSVNEIDPWEDLSAHYIDGQIDCSGMEEIGLLINKAFPIPDVDAIGHYENKTDLIQDIGAQVLNSVEKRTVADMSEFGNAETDFICRAAISVTHDYGIELDKPPVIFIKIRPEWIEKK